MIVSEVKRGLIRIGANYTRIGTTIILSLIVVPLLLQTLGNDGLALILLLGSALGLPTIIQTVTRASMIQELGEAHHSGSPDRFRSVYNAAITVSAVAALLALIGFGILWLVVPWLKIPNELIASARWLVFARGMQTFIVLLTAAPFNMYKVTERMVAYNAWLIVNRSCFIVAALWLLITYETVNPALAITLYAVISSALMILALLTATATIIVIDRRLIPTPSSTTRSAIKSLLVLGGWNAGATSATSIHLRVGELITNLVFALAGNLVLGLAVRVTDAVRRLTVGMTEGLDAVATRLSTTADTSAVRTLMHHSTRLHGVAAFPLAIIILLVPEILLRLWLGARIEDPQRIFPLAITLTQIMTLGMVARAVSDGWIRILYGAGHVGRYAWMLIAGAVMYPLLVGLLLVILPADSRYTAVTWAYSAVLVIVHGLLVPLAGARALRIRYAEFFVPLVRPLIVAVVCSPMLLLAHGRRGQSELLWLIAALALYGVTYLGLCVAFVMNQPERRRFTKAALRRLPFRRPGRTDDMH